jgi:DNA polymerase elongation subunit (family B)
MEKGKNNFNNIIDFDYASLYPSVQKDFTKLVRNILRRNKIKKILDR